MILVFGMALFSAGCYQHVIDVKGPGRGSYDIYEPHFEPQEKEDIK